jgi:hypothetical protein
MLGFLLSSCGSSRKMSNYVPFTKDMMDKIEKENIDLKEVQFYVDEKLILARNLDNETVEVKSGVVKLEKAKNVNEVVIPMLSPGLYSDKIGDKLLISFERGNSALAFGPGSGHAFNQYVIYGTQWKNGTALVDYDAGQYRARCGSCSDVASATLVIKKKVLENMKRKSRTVKGMSITK